MDLPRLNLGPLTTPFVYPLSCTPAYLACEVCTVAVQAQACGERSFSNDIECWPSPSLEVDSTRLLSGFYSPGISCPVGYTSACWSTNGGHAEFIFDATPTASETAVGCCPSGFKCTHLTSKDVCNGIGCTSIATDGDSSLQKCVSIARSTEYNARLCTTRAITPAERTLPGNVTVTTTYPTKSTILVTVRIAENDDSTSTIVSTLVKGPYITSTQMTAPIPSISIFAPLIQLVHQPSDLSNGTSIITTGVETITAMQDSHSSSSLSTGAKAGIGVASAVLALALIGAAFFFLSRKRSRIKLPEPVGESSYASPHDGAYELASSGQNVELPASNETGTIIGTKQPEQESNSIFELPG